MYNFEYYGFSLLCYIQRECNSRFRDRSKSKSSSRKSSSKSESSSKAGKSCREGFKEGREVGEVKKSAEFFESCRPVPLTGNISEVHRVLNYELRRNGDPTASGRPALCVLDSSGKVEYPGYIDYSRLDEVAELDLVSKWYPETMELPPEDVKALGDACYELGLSEVLWQVSQWVPDRRRSALVMVDDSGPAWSRGRIIAASIGDKSFSLGEGVGARTRRGRERKRGTEGRAGEKVESELVRVKSSQMERLCIKFNEIRLKSKGQRWL